MRVSARLAVLFVLATTLSTTNTLSPATRPDEACATATAREILMELAGKPWLGVKLEHHGSSTGKVLVLRVQENSPAGRAGIRVGDAIVGLGSVDFTSFGSFAAADRAVGAELAKLVVGRPTNVLLERGGKRSRIMVTPTRYSYEAAAEHVGSRLLQKLGPVNWLE